jgi:hypothetical protein
MTPMTPLTTGFRSGILKLRHVQEAVLASVAANVCLERMC